jgi:hypothetical protein
VATPSATSASNTSWMSRLPGASTSCMSRWAACRPSLRSLRRASARRPAGHRDCRGWPASPRRQRPGPTGGARSFRARHRSAGTPRAARPIPPSRRARRARVPRPCLGEHRRVRADESRQGVHVLTALGIALVRHRDAADGVPRGRLAQLADLRRWSS